jgi:hypothetical protein
MSMRESGRRLQASLGRVGVSASSGKARLPLFSSRDGLRD